MHRGESFPIYPKPSQVLIYSNLLV